MEKMEQNGTEDEMDEEDETEEDTNEPDDEGGEGIPGFTAVAVLLADLVVVLRRRV